MFALTRALRAEVWKVALDTPLYQALGCGNLSKFVVKKENLMFSDAADFLKHTEQIKESLKHENDICLEAACRKLAERNAEEQRKHSTRTTNGKEVKVNVAAAKQPTPSDSNKAKDDVKVNTEVSKQQPNKSQSNEDRAKVDTEVKQQQQPQSTKPEDSNREVIIDVESDEIKIELLKSRPDEPILTYTKKDGTTITSTGVPSIREFLRGVSNGKQKESLSNNASKLVRLIEIYIPAQPRPNYTMEGAFGIVRQKFAQKAAPDSSSSTNTSPPPRNQTESRMAMFRKTLKKNVKYETGSEAERSKLDKINVNRTSLEKFPKVERPTAEDSSMPVSVFSSSNKQHPFLKKTEEDYLIIVDGVEYPLLDFLAKTDSTAYDQIEFVQNARHLYTAITAA
eukprot:TRINITY_DN3728_c1_g2_i1.p1 TRINITY_DN3728_c1_g2~~TRINITY_DN3728_c1_g2_i1.p1  ORF type:complete len:396 (+),score=93.68 TRINITY_DN3728_c1_g2_i1:37-1224(+)